MNTNEKNKYESAEITVIALSGDVIETSGGGISNGFDGITDEF